MSENKYELSPEAREARRQYYRELQRKRRAADPVGERKKHARYQQAYWEKKAREAQQKEDKPNV